MAYLYGSREVEPLEKVVEITIPVATQFGKPDPNGRIYSQEIVQNAFDRAIKERGSIPITLASSEPTWNPFDTSGYTVDPFNIIGHVFKRLPNDQLVCEFSSRSAPLVDTLVHEAGFVCGFRGIGTTSKDENGNEVVNKLDLISFSLMPPLKRGDNCDESK